MKKDLRDDSRRSGLPGSPGRIRTCDTLINSQLRYHCATGECVVRHARIASIAKRERLASAILCIFFVGETTVG